MGIESCYCPRFSITSLKSLANILLLEVSLQALTKSFSSYEWCFWTKEVSVCAKFTSSSVNDHIFPTIINTSVIYKLPERLRYVGGCRIKVS